MQGMVSSLNNLHMKGSLMLRKQKDNIIQIHMSELQILEQFVTINVNVGSVLNATGVQKQNTFKYSQYFRMALWMFYLYLSCT